MLDKEETLHTSLLFGDDARKELYKGLAYAAEAVGCTLGPKGKTVIIASADKLPIVTKDGVTVIKSIKLKNPAQRAGADILKEAASSTNEGAGDGTTTSTVLAHALVKEGMSLLQNHQAREVCEGFEVLVDRTKNVLRAVARQVKTVEDIKHVAAISANNDEELGDLISRAVDKVGSTGIVTVEDAKGLTTSLTFVEGMQLDRGYISPYFVNSDEKMRVSYQNARVLVTDKKIATMRDLVTLLERSIRENFPLFIIAGDVEGEALHTLIVNKMNNNLKVVAVKSPGYGSLSIDMMNDLCTFTGATLVSSTNDIKLENVQMQHLGTLSRVVVDAKSSLLVSHPSNRSKIDAEVKKLSDLLSDVTLTKQQIEQLQHRIMKLGASAAVINVGGSTDVEIVEKKYRIEDALNATRAAVAEGILQGGGNALLRASREIDTSDVEDAIGKAFCRALRAPFVKIIENSGQSPDVVMNETLKSTLGYNAANGSYVDMWNAGIVDPARVTRLALENATSVATTFLSMDAAVIEE